MPEACSAAFCEPLQPFEVLEVASSDRVVRQEPIEEASRRAGQVVFIAHLHDAAVSSGLDFPPLHPAHPVGVLKPPLENAAKGMFRNHGRE